MRTVFEIETFLRRSECTMRLERPAGAKFRAVVHDGAGIVRGSGDSAALADAIENAMAEMRMGEPARASRVGPFVPVACPDCGKVASQTLGTPALCTYCGKRWIA